VVKSILSSSLLFEAISLRRVAVREGVNVS
jgi:hypothetical protein